MTPHMPSMACTKTCYSIFALFASNKNTNIMLFLFLVHFPLSHL
jgi:hypothetical protein